MSGTIGKSKDTSDKDGFRQFVINCLGTTDSRKYFSLTPFGTDYNLPEDTRVLTLDSKNKDDRFAIGVLNKKWLDDLLPGENAIFSTDDVGEELVSKVVLRNTGDIEINKDVNSNAFISIKADGAIHFNGDVDTLAGFKDLKAGFDQLLSDHNDLVSGFNAHMHATAAVGPPSPPTPLPPNVPGTSSTASIDSSEKPKLKTE